MPEAPDALPSANDAKTVWSTWIQPAAILDVTRELRFRDEVRGLLWPVLGLKQGGVAVDVGSGSGALTRALARWMGPGCTVYGVDRDENFVRYSAERARALRLGRRTRYLQGDAHALPLPDGIADAVTSYTVIEHVPEQLAFLREQMRVCKRGGRVSVMNVWPRAAINAESPPAPVETARERELWALLQGREQEEIDTRWGVGKHSLEPYDLVRLFERAGLTEIMVDGFGTPKVFDDVRMTRDTAERYLQAEEDMYLANITRISSVMATPPPASALDELRRLVRARFAKRRRMLRAGRAVWDYGVGLSLVVSGKVPR
jgi:SAM-dependent methyltransferase